MCSISLEVFCTYLVRPFLWKKLSPYSLPLVHFIVAVLPLSWGPCRLGMVSRWHSADFQVSFLVICRPSPIYSATQDKHIFNYCLLVDSLSFSSITDSRRDRWSRSDMLYTLRCAWNWQLWQYNDLFNLHDGRSCPLWLQHWNCTGLAYSEWFVAWVDARVGMVPEGYHSTTCVHSQVWILPRRLVVTSSSLKTLFRSFLQLAEFC